MKNSYKLLVVIAICIAIISCSKSSSDDFTIRDYATQYKTDSLAIESYLDTHFITYDSDFNVTFDTLLPTSGHSSIRTDSSLDLRDTLLYQNGINYKVHYIRLRQGDITNGRRPTQVDSVFIAYKGVKLTKSSTTGHEDVFDRADSPVWFKLQDVISGWTHLIPAFKTGTYTPSSGNNPATFNNFGAGVMFLPSGLGYYNNATASLSSYSPLIFSFKLMELRYRDHDGDGILSKDERGLTDTNSQTRWRENPGSDAYDVQYNPSTKVYTITTIPFLDTDGDGIADMYDSDDDGDTYLTRAELSYINPVTGIKSYYNFSNAPDCSGSASSPTRIRKYLDKTCH
ncbi:FKBP-type peptidyl-prolyl cis-trans isomerase [Flavobacterium aciduliphilum]|uniref:Peptidylprolyl isomerase n=1 Tax=Flavobacterium aciduliphilum TaxID=1101402 RepID=A0A328YNS0_9FLAO|nr:hypothetical protein [Flavobacterium aciduliphilum]RAR75701.1 hypothetical protein CLV55_101401 [Flavobacterium aciduliphilum]